jgi:hypothetical protein
MVSTDFRDSIRDGIDKWSQSEYKRGSGFEIRESNIIMKQAEKYFSKEKQLLIATYIFGGTRNEEGRKMSLDCYNREQKRLELLKPFMTKQDRKRVVLDVPDKIFQLAEEVQKEYGYSPNEKLFSKYSDDDVREMIKDCCRLGKVKYSGVHDFRKSYLERMERDAFKQILSGKLTKADLIDKIMTQVSADPKLNQLVPKKIWAQRITKDGKTKYYPKNHPTEKDMKFSVEKLQKMNIENILDLYIAEQLGHNKQETNNEYRSEEAKARRQEFRKTVQFQRKKGRRF